MFFSYTSSVLLLSFAMFGIWCFGRELWIWLVEPHLLQRPKISFLILVKDIEQEIEEMLRHLMLEVDGSALDCEVLVMDCGSEDLTRPIVRRLAREFHGLTSLGEESAPGGIGDALARCSGGVVHLIDTVHRMDPKHFVPVICWLLKEEIRDRAEY